MIMDKSKGDILKYCSLQTDNDYNDYYFLRNEVIGYPYNDEKMNELIKVWKDKLNKMDDYLYIKRNYLFFTLNGSKFFIKLTCFTSEWRNIDRIISDFEKLSDSVSYLFGELD